MTCSGIQIRNSLKYPLHTSNTVRRSKVQFLNFSPLTCPNSAAEGKEFPDTQAKLRDCEAEKDVYDQCFRNWYRHSFLRGDTEDRCEVPFRDYNACLKKSLDSKGLGSLMDPSDPIWNYESP